MKYEGKRPSGADKEIMVYQFVMGKEECRLLFDMATKLFLETKKITELTITRSRLKTMLKGLHDALESSKN